MNYAQPIINPFYAARMQPAVRQTPDRPDEPVYAKLPAAPRNASPVPHLTSLYYNSRAGEYGDRSYPGTCGDVCDELGIPCLSWDIHGGFDACDPEVFTAREAFDFIWAHPADWIS